MLRSTRPYHVSQDTTGVVVARETACAERLGMRVMDVEYFQRVQLFSVAPAPLNHCFPHALADGTHTAVCMEKQDDQRLMHWRDVQSHAASGFRYEPIRIQSR